MLSVRGTILGVCLCTALSAQTVDRRYSGTVDGFAAALLGFLQRAMAEHHFRKENYEEETRYLIDLARTCAEITPEKALKLQLPPMLLSKVQPAMWPEADRIYAPCIPAFAGGFTPVDLAGRNYDRATRRGVVFLAKAVGTKGYLDGRGFLLRVMFTALESDAPPTRRDRTPAELLIDDYRLTLHLADVGLPGGVNSLEGLFDTYGIVCASIQGPGQQLGPPGACPPPVAHGAPSHSIDETFAQAVRIVNENAAKGVPDALASRLSRFTGLTVCYLTGVQCTPTGDLVRLPGDLDVPADFWNTLGRRCGPGSDMVEVAVKGAPPGGRKKFLNCMNAFELNFRRKGLIRDGVSK